MKRQTIREHVEHFAQDHPAKTLFAVMYVTLALLVLFSPFS